MPTNKPPKNSKKIKQIAEKIQDTMDSLYRTTYFSSPQSNKDVKNLAQDINNNIDQIVSRNMGTFGKPSISTLYTRIFEKSNKGKGTVPSEISKMFEVDGAMDDMYSSFMMNRYLVELDDEIDTICRYMPDLEEALSVLKDSTLSADHFSKDFLSIRFPTNIADDKFSKRIDELKKKYKLQKMTEEIFDDVSKYGEKFIYIVPYKVAIARLLATKPDTNIDFAKFGMRNEDTKILQESVISNYTESYSFNMGSKEAKIVSESESFKCDTPSIMSVDKKLKTNMQSILSEDQKVSFKIELNQSGIIDEAIIEAANSIRIKKRTRSHSLRESFYSSQGSRINEDSKKPEAKGNLNSNNIFKNKTDLSIDGLYSGNKNSDVDDYMTNTPGAVVKYLKRERVIPIYIEQTCMGYYYLEFKDNNPDLDTRLVNTFTNPLSNIGSGLVGISNVDDSIRQDSIIRYIAGQLSSFIDKKFVNTNQDISKEIYEILKCNDLLNTPSIDTIKVTFIPPEDMHHCWFKFDNESHRGISDLAKGLIPAKLYTSLLVSNSIGIMTRGQDKRIYYVNQMVDTNTAQQLINVVEQVKLGNFGIRQFNSINNVLGIIGRFNEHIIPRGPGGNSPIDIDVIQGQQFDIHQDLMEELKSAAIDSTTVPIEIIQTRKSIDYAMQLSMSSSKFLRTTYKRQEAVEAIMSPIISMIYNYEYDENYDLQIVLPPPVFLNMANTTQLINNTKEAVQAMVDVEMASEEDDTLKNMYINNLFMHYIGTHIDISTHKDILEQTKIEKKQMEDESQIEAESPPEDNGGGGDDYSW